MTLRPIDDWDLPFSLYMTSSFNVRYQFPIAILVRTYFLCACIFLTICPDILLKLTPLIIS